MLNTATVQQMLNPKNRLQYCNVITEELSKRLMEDCVQLALPDYCTVPSSVQIAAVSLVYAVPSDYYCSPKVSRLVFWITK